MVIRNDQVYLKIGVSIVTMAMVVACTGKKSERVHHDGPIRHNYGPVLNETQAGDAVAAAYAQSGKTAQLFGSTKAGAQDILVSLKQLADVVLNSSVISNTELSGRTDFKSLLGTFNRGLVRAMELDMNAVRQSGLLKRYEDILFEGSIDGTLQQTFNLPLFRDHLTSRILTTIAKELAPTITSERNNKNGADGNYAKAVARYYRLLFAAYDVTTHMPADDLNLAYVQMAQDYYELIKIKQASAQSSPNKTAILAEIGEAHRRHNQNFNLALTQIRDRFKSQSQRAEYCKFVMATNPLSFEVAQSQDFDRRTLRFFVSEFIECAAPGNNNTILVQKISERLHAEKKEAEDLRKKDLENERKPENSKNLMKVEDHNISYVMQELREIPQIAKNLGVDVNMATNPLAMFVIDQLFYERIDETMARSYWEKLGKVKDEELIKYIRNYARAQMVNEIKNTLQNYAKILRQEFDKRGGLGTGYFDDVIKRMNNHAQLGWEVLKTRQRFLRNFATAVFDHKLAKGTSVRTDYLNFREEIDSINEHMGISVLTPMNMILNYYMAKSLGNIKIFVPWWPGSNQYFTTDARYALLTFMVNSESQYQFFRLGNMVYEMDRLKRMHAMDFSFRSGIFDLLPFDLLEEDKKLKPYPETHVTANNHYLFYKQIFKDVFNFFDGQFKVQNTRLDNIANNKNFSERFLNACKDPMSANVTIELSVLSMGTLLEEEQFVKPVISLYDTGSFMTSWRMLRDLVKNYIAVLKAQKDNSGVERIEKEFARYEQMERSFYKKVFALDRLLVDNQQDCIMNMHKADYHRRDLIFKQNIEFYKDVHAAIRLLNLIDGQPTDVAFNSAESVISNWAASQTAATASDVAQRMRKLIKTLKTIGLTAMGRQTVEEGLNLILSIHNFDQAPFVTPSSELGFFVTGAPLYSKEQRELKRLNRFTKAGFSQARWDSLMRVRRQLQTTVASAAETNAVLGTEYKSDYVVGRNIDIPIGSSFGELDNDGLYRDNKVKPVGAYEDQTEFVKAAMFQFAGADNGSQYISWLSDGGGGAYLFMKRFSWLMEISELGTIELEESDASTCPRDEWDNTVGTQDIYGNSIKNVNDANKACKAVKVTPKNILDAFITLGKFISLSDFDKEMLIWTDRPGKNHNMANKFFGYRSELSTAKWTWFDEFYRKYLVTETRYVQKTDGSYDKVSIETLRGRDEFETHRDSWLLNVRPPRHLLPLSGTPTQLDRNATRRLMLTHMNSILDYETVIEQIEDSKEDLGIVQFERVLPKAQRSDEKYIDGLWRFVPINKRTTGERVGTPIYLEDQDRTKAWYASYLETFFVKETECEALPKESDPDGKLLGADLARVTSAKSSCIDRFKIWRQWRNKNLKSGGTDDSVTHTP